MTRQKNQQILRAIPPVDQILSDPALARAMAEHTGFPWTRCVREATDALRGGAVEESSMPAPERDAVQSWVVAQVMDRFEALMHGGLKPVINGTGVILHTNLGRAVLGGEALAAAGQALTRYVSLEVDLESGERSKRGTTLNDLAALASGGEAAMVVNNNAAAVYLAVNSYSPPGRVIVSRGELVEIGGSFRLPEILRRAANEVVDVGTTNRTYARDYAEVARSGDIILRVHKSNYVIEGFTHEATLPDLVAVARETGSHVVYDLGSGALFDYRRFGLGKDSHVSEVVATGVDCVTMSGDKLLGGMQAGILVGKAAFLKKLKQNSLRRAVRVDKVTIAALQSVFRAYLFGADPAAQIPVLAQVSADLNGLLSRAERILDAVNQATGGSPTASVVDDDATVGGGSLASEVLPSVAVAIACKSDGDAVKLARSMRAFTVPVFTRIKGAEVRINLRTVLAEEDDRLIECLSRALS